MGGARPREKAHEHPPCEETFSKKVKTILWMRKNSKEGGNHGGGGFFKRRRTLPHSMSSREDTHSYENMDFMSPLLPKLRRLIEAFPLCPARAVPSRPTRA